MRLTPEQIQSMRRIARRLAGAQVGSRVSGSRLDHRAGGSKLDRLATLPEPVANPARLTAQVSAQSRRLLIRKVAVDQDWPL